MPWGENNKGGDGPWGKPPSSNQQPDIDELLKKGSERFNQFFSGGNKGTDSRFYLIGLLIALVIWLGSGFYIVKPEQEGVVLRFGAFHRIAVPGPNYHMPWPVERVVKIPVTTVNEIKVGVRSTGRGNFKVSSERLTLTGDENIVEIEFAVQWRVKSAADFLFNLQGQSETVKMVAESAMRDVVGRRPINDALTDKRKVIAFETQELIQSILDNYGAGVEIVQVLLNDAQPPSQVIDAFRDVQTAKLDQERARNEAEAYRNDIIPRARGEAEKTLQDAHAYKEQVVAQANGETQRFISILHEYKIAKDVTKKRIYLETMEEVLAEMEKILVDNESGGTGVIPYLALPELSKRSK